jgi:hypothetical protein
MLPIQPNAVPATITEGCAGRPVRLFDPLAVMTVVVIVEDAALLVAVDVKKDGVVGRVRSHGRCLLRRRPLRGTQPAATLQHTRTFVRCESGRGSLMTPGYDLKDGKRAANTSSTTLLRLLRKGTTDQGMTTRFFTHTM